MKAKPLPNIAELRARYRYDPDIGKIFYAKSEAGIAAGSEAGTPNVDGYIRIRFCKGGERRRLHAHRVAWALYHGSLADDTIIDHANGIRSDNRLSNLRLATVSQNTANSKKCSRGSLPKGIRSLCGKYQARIMKNGKRRNLGVFETLMEAVAAYRKGAEEDFGGFARVA